MTRHPFQALRRWAKGLPRVLVFATGLFVGGIIGVVFSVLAFSAFLFQVLQAISTAVLALATVVLALSTLSLYRATRVLAKIESNRELRARLRRRIRVGEKMMHLDASPFALITPIRENKFRYDPAAQEVASLFRELRQLIGYEETNRDPEVRGLIPPLDLLILKVDAADRGEPVIENDEDETTIRQWLNMVQRLLIILVPRWRSQIQFLYE